MHGSETMNGLSICSHKRVSSMVSANHEPGDQHVHSDYASSMSHLCCLLTLEAVSLSLLIKCVTVQSSNISLPHTCRCVVQHSIHCATQNTQQTQTPCHTSTTQNTCTAWHSTAAPRLHLKNARSHTCTPHLPSRPGIAPPGVHRWCHTPGSS